MADMSPRAVTERLRQMSAMSPLRIPLPSRTDMSPRAVTQRLRDMAQLLRLQLKLKPRGPHSRVT